MLNHELWKVVDVAMVMKQKTTLISKILTIIATRMVNRLSICQWRTTRRFSSTERNGTNYGKGTVKIYSSFSFQSIIPRSGLSMTVSEILRNWLKPLKSCSVETPCHKDFSWATMQTLHRSGRFLLFLYHRHSFIISMINFSINSFNL